MPTIYDVLGIKNDWRSQLDFTQKTVAKALQGAVVFEDILRSGGLRGLFQKCLPGSVADDFCELVIRFKNYTYNYGSYRRSFRSDSPGGYGGKLQHLVSGIFFDWTKFNLPAYLALSDAEKREMRYESPSQEVVSMLIAQRIDRNDQCIIDAVTDIILSENNTRAVSHELICGVAMSRNERLHGLMKDLLLAARLQEGLRQAILETADDGVLEYFLLIIKTVLENDLLRYSSALRAVNVWMGLGYDYADRRAVEKLLKLAYAYIEQDGERRAAIGSADVLRMYAAMWAESVFSIQNLQTHIESCMGGKKYQKLVGAYFLAQTGDTESAIRLSGEALMREMSLLGETDMPGKMDWDTLTLILANYSLKLYNVSEYRSWRAHDAEGPGEVDRSRYPECLKDDAVRDGHFACLARLFAGIPKNGYTVESKPFDWVTFTLSRGEVFESMMVLAAYDFDAAKHRQLMELFPLATSDNWGNFLGFFIARDISGANRPFLLDCLSVKSLPVRAQAVKMLQKLSLKEEEMLAVEELLALKTGGIRQTALDIIRGAGDVAVRSSIDRLIGHKNDNKRLAALDLMSSEKQSGRLTSDAINKFLVAMPKTTEAEAVIIGSLTDNDVPQYSEENGFGLYDPTYFPALPPVESGDEGILKTFRSVRVQEMVNVFDSLLALIEEYKDYTYKAALFHGGERDCILGNATYLDRVPHESDKEDKGSLEDYVLGEVWRGWMESNHVDLLMLIRLAYCQTLHQTKYYQAIHEYVQFVHDLLEKYFDYDKMEEFVRQRSSHPYYALACDIIGTLLGMMPERAAACHAILAEFFLAIPREKWSKGIYDPEQNHWKTNDKLANAGEIAFFIGRLNGDDAEYAKRLALKYAIGAASGSRYIVLSLEDVAHAVREGLIDKTELCRAVIEIDQGRAIRLYTGTRHSQVQKNAERYPVLAECVETVANRVIEIELRRGDTGTPVSHLAVLIARHEGAAVFVRILAALGKETLQRGYIWGGHTKREVLSSLLRASVPAGDDSAETLRAALGLAGESVGQGPRIPDKRLLEAAMYAPAWIAIIQDYLGWEGLKSAAWYFHAHTRDGYSPDFETEVARFSPIDKEDFQRGAFDIAWFKEAYATLGAERFAVLYGCAKYITTGAAHRRAQVFADAVLGNLSAAEMEPKIRDKRNKDLLLAYSLVPLGESQAQEAELRREALNRYEFVNAFLKKSREFGSQRQASEKAAASIALENLARNLGYTDALRFTWQMEMEKLEAIQSYFQPSAIGETTLFLAMDDEGMAELIVEKKGKRLKSIPAAIKKEAYVKEIGEVKASLKAQYSRARVSLERAMVNRDAFGLGEVADLLKHPVIGPILRKLVFRSEDELGFLRDSVLVRSDGTECIPAPDAVLTIAHCRDFFVLGQWSAYQRYAFENSLVQPFKQIFRELYMVNEDEKSEKIVSRRYAGNQIQPKKAVALLKGRGWTVDYENGLQKVCYQENVVASMYAVADWFSPSDIEAPMVETVCFYERKTGKPLGLEAIQPVLFSEVMRDVDLVVSVAHVGGVDPMASHSTIDMRAVIVAESVRLMKLKNVTVDDRHARIKGSLGVYSVHLGSGQAHMMGRGALTILPVHSQHRGRLFLPFMDEDPKTAEIVAKTLLLAEDTKIKDPSVMFQING